LLVPVFAGNQAAHDLPERVFGRSSAQDPVGPGELADVGGDVSRGSDARFRRALEPSSIPDDPEVSVIVADGRLSTSNPWPRSMRSPVVSSTTSASTAGSA
jgi:hypothetical protein